MADGAIRINTRIDNSEIPKDLSKLNSMLDDAKSRIMELAKALNFKVDPLQIVDDDVLRETEKRIKTIQKEIEKIQADTERQDIKIYADKSLTDDEKDAKSDALLSKSGQLIADLKARQDELTAAAEAYRAKQAEITAEKQRQLEIAEAEAQRQAQEDADIKDVNAGVSESLAADDFLAGIQTVEQYNAILDETQEKMWRIEEATRELAAEKGIDPDKALEANAEYQKLSKQLETLTNDTRKLKKETSGAFSIAKSSAASMGDSIKSALKQMSKYTLAIFGARSAFFAVKNAIRQVLADNEQLNQTVTAMKGAFATAIAPYVEYLVNLLKYALAYLNLFIKTLTGVDIVAKYNTKALKKQAEAAKKAKNQLAAFDEKNVLSNNDSSTNKAKDKYPTLDLPDVSGGKFEEICETIKRNLADIEAFVGGVLIGVGLVLLVCGQIPLGIAAIMAGIALEAAAIGNADEMKNSTKTLINTIMLIAGGALLAIGLILCSVGQLPMGIAAIALGVALIVSAIAMKVNEMPAEVQNMILKIMGIAGAALLALGVILVLAAGQVPLGIALIAAGAALLVTSIALAADKLPSEVRNFLQVIFALVSVAMLVLGIILLCTGVHLMLGVALTAAGAALLVTTVALNWGKLSEDTQKTISVIAGIASAAMLVLGIILCATGVALPLGIALIAAGVVGLVTAVALNKDTVKNWVSGAWSSVKSFWSSKIAPIFTAQWWSNKLATIAQGAKNAINTAISYIERGINWMVGKINSIGFTAPSWVPGIGGQRVGFNLPYVNIPRLAKGGIVSNPGRGVDVNVGEAGREAILPLESNTEWMEILAEKIADKIPSNTIVKVYVDGKELYGTRTKTEQRYTFATNGGVL